MSFKSEVEKLMGLSKDDRHVFGERFEKVSDAMLKQFFSEDFVLSDRMPMFDPDVDRARKFVYLTLTLHERTGMDLKTCEDVMRNIWKILGKRYKLKAPRKGIEDYLEGDLKHFKFRSGLSEPMLGISRRGFFHVVQESYYILTPSGQVILVWSALDGRYVPVVSPDEVVYIPTGDSIVEAFSTVKSLWERSRDEISKQNRRRIVEMIRSLADRIERGDFDDPEEVEEMFDFALRVILDYLSLDHHEDGDGDLESFNPVALGKDGTVYVVDDGRVLRAYTPDGLLKWIFPGVYSVPVVRQDGVIYVGCSDGVCALAPNGEVLWLEDTYTPQEDEIFGYPAVGDDGTLYIAYDLGILAISPDGEYKWVEMSPEEEWADIVVDSKGNIHAQSGDTFYTISEDGELLSEITLDIDFDAFPKIFAVDEEGNVYFSTLYGVGRITKDEDVEMVDLSKGEFDVELRDMFVGPARMTKDGRIYSIVFHTSRDDQVETKLVEFSKHFKGRIPLASSYWPMTRRDESNTGGPSHINVDGIPSYVGGMALRWLDEAFKDREPNLDILSEYFSRLFKRRMARSYRERYGTALERFLEAELLKRIDDPEKDLAYELQKRYLLVPELAIWSVRVWKRYVYSRKLFI